MKKIRVKAIEAGIMKDNEIVPGEVWIEGKKGMQKKEKGRRNG